MSYIPDLHPRSYSEIAGPIRAVGWLEFSHPYTRGPVTPEFSRRLMQLIERPVWAYFSLGMHWCSLCLSEGKCGPDCRSSQAVLFVPASSCVYESPIWIGHYVLGHGYQPPAEFCRAVMSCPEPGSDEFRKALCALLPELTNVFIAEKNLFFRDWSDGARRTLESDSVHGRHRAYEKPDRTIDLVPREDGNDRRQRRQRDYLEFYDRLGPEEAARPCKKDGCTRGSVRFSVFCRRHHFEQIKRCKCPFDH